MKTKRFLITSVNKRTVVLPESVIAVLTKMSKGLKTDEIRESLGIPISRIYSLQFRGLTALEISWTRGVDRIKALRESLKSLKELSPSPVKTEPTADRYTLAQEDSLARIIQDIRYAGDSPLLQYDLLDSVALLATLTEKGLQLTNHRLRHTLTVLGMRYMGRFSVSGVYRYLWTSLPPQNVENLVAVFRERVETGAHWLQRELHLDYIAPAPNPSEMAERLTSEELNVLRMRLDNTPPRLIAQTLRMDRLKVYTMLQSLRTKLGFKSWKNREDVRKASEGITFPSLDPADY